MKTVNKGITKTVLSMKMMIDITIISNSCANHEPINKDIQVR